jgi:putative transposase
MPRRRCSVTEEFVYHVINRGAKRSRLFARPSDYSGFEAILQQARARSDMRILAYCVMPNHWHFVLWPSGRVQLSTFMHWLTLTHTHRWQRFHDVVGTGAVYQGSYKALPVQTDTYLLNVCRYVERNPLRAGLVRRAQDWQWSSLWRRERRLDAWLEPWPIARPENWVAMVNGDEDGNGLAQIRHAIARNSPLGEEVWSVQTAKLMGLESTLRRPGRPKKDPGTVSLLSDG